MAFLLGMFGVAAIGWSLLALSGGGREAHWRYEAADLRARGIKAEKSDDWEKRVGFDAVVCFIIGVALLVLAFTR